MANKKSPAFSIANDRVFAMATGLALSVVSAFYAVTGLAAIFAGAFIPIIIMGTVLEVGKIITATYLYRNWALMPRAMRAYFISAVAVLMIITSMGVFGYLSKAHIEQGASAGDFTAAIERLDQSVIREKTRITTSERMLSQLDAAIDRYISLGQITRGLDARRTQAKEREDLAVDMKAAQASIDALLDQRAPLAQSIRTTQIEVGPIRYVAQLIYGEESEEVLDKAVRYIIIALVLVLDPLAILLIISANSIHQLPAGSNSEKFSHSANSTAVDARSWKEMEGVIITKKRNIT